MTAAERDDLRRLPKAELHLHFEGSLRPEVVWDLSQRHNFPYGLRDLDACRRLYQFTDFAGFIQAIKTASQHLIAPADYAAAVTDLARQLAAQGVIYAEVFLSIGILLWRQVAVEPYWEAIEAARLAAEVETGVRIAWIFDAVRQFGAEPFDRVLDWAIKLQLSNSVIGIGIGGDEAQGPAAWFVAGYDRARAAGLHTTVHAGESCGPQSVWDAITLLHAERIGHGLRAFEDPRLLDLLAEKQIALDICSTSNRKTGVWPSGRRHPVYKYYKRGIKFSVSTDDPGIFGCSLLDEYAILRDQEGFSAVEVRKIAAGAFACSFLPEADRRTLARLPGLAASNAGGDRGVGIK